MLPSQYGSSDLESDVLFSCIQLGNAFFLATQKVLGGQVTSGTGGLWTGYGP